MVTLPETLPREVDKRRFVERMFDAIAPRYDLMNRLMTLGTDRKWRRAAIDALAIDSRSTVLDLGCGTGDLSRAVARTGASVVGFDLSTSMLRLAKRSDSRSRYVRADAAVLPVADRSIDAVISGFAVRNFLNFEAVLLDCARVLKPGGRIVWLEVDVPRSRILRSGFDLYFKRLVPWMGRMLSQGYAYQYLADSLVYLPDEERFRNSHASAGFERVEKRRLTFGAAQMITGLRARSPRTEDDEVQAGGPLRGGVCAAV